MKAKRMKTLDELMLDIDVCRDLVDDIDYMRGLEIEERREILNYILGLQEEYRRQTGQYYIERKVYKDVN